MGCERPRGAAGSTKASCPSDEALAELHAAAFHFQNGPPATARMHLERARAIIRPIDGTKATEVLGKLSEISALIDDVPARAAGETEYVRLAFSDWRCLPAELHRRLHAELPPVPGTTP